MFGMGQTILIQNVLSPDIPACSSGNEHVVEFTNISGGTLTNIVLLVDLPEGLSFESLVDADFTAENIINIGNSSVETLPRLTYDRVLQIRNAGNQSLDEFKITLSYAEGTIAFISSDAGTVIGNQVTLGPGDFSDGTFDPEEDVFVALTEHYVSCVPSTAEYEAWWSCDGVNPCQITEGSAGTNVVPGEPNITVQASSSSDPGPCQIDGWNSFTASNIASEIQAGAAAAHNVKLLPNMLPVVGWVYLAK